MGRPINADSEEAIQQMPTINQSGVEMKRGAEKAAPLAVKVDSDEGRIEVSDRDQRFAYELHFRDLRGRCGGPGWVELTRGPDGALTVFSVTAAEVMEVVRDADCHEHAAALTGALALFFEQAPEDEAARRIAARLRAEVAAGHARERLSVRPLQALILERLVAGETLVDMCERGGFMLAGGSADTSWIQRRAGLAPTHCSRTGKRRLAKTASYQVFCQIVRALDAEPHEFGV